MTRPVAISDAIGDSLDSKPLAVRCGPAGLLQRMLIVVQHGQRRRAELVVGVEACHLAFDRGFADPAVLAIDADHQLHGIEIDDAELIGAGVRIEAEQAA